MPAIAAQQAWGFSLLGPTDVGSDATWQINAYGYDLTTVGDLGGPKYRGQGYRRNCPVLYYAYDENFYQFFDPSLAETDGVAAVDGAFAIMNALTNANNLQVSQFPLNSQQNFDARAMNLLDLKSETLAILLEQLGLTQPVRYTWTLHDVYTPAGATCSTNPLVNGNKYLVTQLNIDPGNLNYSSYVNDTLYSFGLFEPCGVYGVFPDEFTGVTVDELAYPFAEDVNAQANMPVTEAFDPWRPTLVEGEYYTGLTYDDAGGLSYLYATNNLQTETPAPESLLEATNTSQLQLLQTANLYTLMQYAQTNPPGAVEAEFPGIVVNGYSAYYTLVTNWNVYSYFTNYPGSAAGTPPVYVVGTNGFTLGAQTNYVYEFGNVVIVHRYTNTPAKLVTISLKEAPGTPFDAPLIETNISYKKIILTNVISGDYYLIPAGGCGYEIVSTLVSNYFAGTFTNILTAATNAASSNTTTTATGFVGSRSIVTYFTNNWFEVYPCNFTNPVAALYQGVGKVNFIKADFDSTLGQTFTPITNYYKMVTVVNSKPVTQYFQRIVTQPDILLDAQDMATPTALGPVFGVKAFYRTINYTQDPQVAGQPATPSGPGTITDYPCTIAYNDADVYEVSGGAVNQPINYLNQPEPTFIWGSFDSSTNAPIVYPVGSSLQNLENEALVQISPAQLPDATNNVPYSQTLSVTGGSFTQPYTWSLGANPTTGMPTTLPNGLSLSTSSSEGIISGTPATSDADGTYDFVLQMTDVNGRSVTWNYSINIDP